jgi:hypothetical protein
MTISNLINEMFYDLQAGKFERANILIADDFRGMISEECSWERK